MSPFRSLFFHIAYAVFCHVLEPANLFLYDILYGEEVFPTKKNQDLFKMESSAQLQGKGLLRLVTVPLKLPQPVGCRGDLEWVQSPLASP